MLELKCFLCWLIVVYDMMLTWTLLTKQENAAYASKIADEDRGRQQHASKSSGRASVFPTIRPQFWLNMKGRIWGGSVLPVGRIRPKFSG